MTTGIPYTITIQTYEKRYDKYFLPLIASICNQRPNIDKVVFVNAQYKTGMNENFRIKILELMSRLPKVFPIFTTCFRGCSYMWNNSIITSNTQVCLNLSDDITIHEGFFDDYEEKLLSVEGETFKINDSFAHFSINKTDLDDIGYFDERLLGLGQEDGDWQWRFEVKRNRTIKNIYMPNVIHYIEKEAASENMKKCGGKYSPYNTDFMYNYKYDHPHDPRNINRKLPIDPNKPSAVSMFDKPTQMKDGAVNLDYYPNEKNYRENIHKLGE